MNHDIYSQYSKTKKSARDIYRPGFLGGKKSEFGLRNYVFLNFPIFFGWFFYENSTVKLIIDHAVCKGIAATYGQLLLK